MLFHHHLSSIGHYLAINILVRRHHGRNNFALSSKTIQQEHYLAQIPMVTVLVKGGGAILPGCKR
jgi:hypothetical protein